MTDKIFNFILRQVLAETPTSIIYRVEKDAGTAVLKVLRTENPSLAELARLKQECSILKGLNIDGIVRPIDIIESGEGIAILEEDYAGLSLKDVIKKKKKLDMGEFLRVAISVSKTMGELHSKNIVHKDLKPANILVDPAMERVKITGLGISSILFRHDEEIFRPDVIEGTLAYMSPEKTGRTNRNIDYRTDLYSMGVTFYEAITGSLPFMSHDPMEIIHAHIARKPIPAMEMDISIPAVLSEIIDKLMCKTPEERYQSAFGVMHDIERCRKAYDADQSMESFPLALMDTSPHFNIPQVLVGRRSELDTLLNAFDRFVGGEREIVLVEGRPGIGKSALVNEICKPVLARRGHFISGKYDQLRRDVPYSAIIQAFQFLIRQILVENQDKLDKWERELSDALGPNGKLLIDAIPDLEHIIGDKPAVEPMGPEESQNRFIRLFKNFVGVLATQQHPVVLFLDDMQWIDLASLDLVTSLVTDLDVKHFFFIASYRDNEVSSSHPVSAALDKMNKEGGNLTTITLEPLKEENVCELLSNFYKTHVSAIPELASLVFKKTDGNPFFSIQFIKRLHEDGLIQFSPGNGWNWDIGRINAMPLTDNVVELMVQTISRMPAACRELITVCACIGNRFDLEMIAEVMDRAIEEILPVFDSLINAGLIGTFKDIYRFHHDRIQEAAYSLLDEKTRRHLHFRIGNNVLSKTPPEKIHDKVFFILRHLNLSAALISKPEERLALARLNLTAGKKAKDASAFDSALTYFRLGASFLPSDAWERQYDLAFPLFINRAECEYLMGNHETAMSLFEMLSGKAETRLDRAEIYIVRVFLLTNIGKYEDAVLFGLEGLRIFNVKIPLRPTMPTVIKEILKMKWALLGRNIEQLIDLPMIEDPEIIVMIRLLESCSQAVYYTNKNLVLISPLILMRTILRYGHCYLSPYILGVVAGIVGPGLGDYRKAEKFYQLSNQLIEKIHYRKIGNVYFVQAYLYVHWAKHIKDSIALFRKAHSLFLDMGSFEFACHSLNNILDYSFIMGGNLDEIFEEYQKYENFIKSQKDAFFDAYFNDNMRKYQCYKGLTDGLHTLDKGDGYGDKRLNEIRSTKNNLDKFIYLCNLIKINYLAGKFTEAYAFVEEIDPLKNDLIGNLYLPEFVFYYALTVCALCRGKSTRKPGVRSKIKSLIGRMKKWSAVCPQNYEHKYFLMAAELEALRGRRDKAVEFYLKAVESCAQQGFLNNEALAHELLGGFYIACKEDSKAAKQITQAYRCYLMWGAAAKADALLAEYPHLVSSKILAEARDHDATQSTSLMTPRSANALDLSSALKAAGAVSGELVLEKLLKNLIKILMENAGAQRGFLILETDGRLAIEARVDVLDKGISVMESIPVSEQAGLSPAVVQFAVRTKEKVILHDATTDPLYASDPHIIKNRPKSVLCLPILNQGKVTAILYLENNLTTNAFTPDRIEFLTVFTSQAAVSIDNARLYANLEKKVEDRTHQLKAARDALWGEMRLAAKIQTLLIPRQPSIPGYEIFGYMLPADEVGGDYYDIISTDEVGWVLIGDVAGHGVSAGLVMMMVQTSIQTLIREHASIMPRDLLTMANRTVAYNIGLMNDDKYVTLTACRISRDGRIIFSGLHQDMFLYRALSGSVERIETEGMWLGFEMDISGMITNSEIQMRDGDVLLMYTDGITEARNDRGEMFEQERIAEVLKKSAGKSPAEINQDIFSAIEGYHSNDDQTVVILKKDRTGSLDPAIY